MLSAKFFLAVQLDLCVDNMATTKACIFEMGCQFGTLQ